MKGKKRHEPKRKPQGQRGTPVPVPPAARGPALGRDAAGTGRAVPYSDTSCISLFVGKFGKDRTGEQVHRAGGLPRARGISSWSCAVPASACARARPGGRGAPVRDASLSVRSRVPFARVRSAVAGAGGAAGAGPGARHGAVLAAGPQLPADVPGAAAAPGPAARPAAAPDLARGLARGRPCRRAALPWGTPPWVPGISTPSRWSVCSVNAVIRAGRGAAPGHRRTLHQQSL